MTNARGLLMLGLASLVLHACPAPTTPPPDDTGNTNDVVAQDNATDTPVSADSSPVDVSSDAPAVDAWVPAPHRDWVQVPANMHEVLSPVTFVTIVSSGDPAMSDLFAASDEMANGAWYRAAVAGYDIMPVMTSTHVTGPAITSDMTNAQMVQYIDDLISAGTVPASNGNTFYMLYLPPGVAFQRADGTANSCDTTWGVHYSFHAGGDGWAWVMRCSVMGGRTDTQIATNTGSHEFFEALTDPVIPRGFTLGRPPTSNPWQHSIWQSYEASGPNELGDLCEGTQIIENGVLLQRQYNNAAAARGGDPCVPPASEPYYNVTTPQEWYTVDSSGVADIPVTGWTTGPTEDWPLSRYVKNSSDSSLTWTLRITGAHTLMVGSTLFTTINNGETDNLRVTAPTNAVSGSWAVIQISSKRFLANGFPDPALDQWHIQLVGVYVP